MEACQHYRHWQTDFDLVQWLGLRFLRYGPPLYRTWVGPGQYDWSFADETFADLLRRDLVPIVDLCHFGVPDWLGNFQNPDFARLFPDYCRAFAQRFPWVQLYTPINEMFHCALFSAGHGWWNEQLTGNRSFVTALKNIVKRNVLAMESFSTSARRLFRAKRIVRVLSRRKPGVDSMRGVVNSKRFLTLDLNYGPLIRRCTSTSSTTA